MAASIRRLGNVLIRNSVCISRMKPAFFSDVHINKGKLDQLVCSKGVVTLRKRQFHATCCKQDIFNVQDADDFNERVLKSPLPVIVDFHATWCGPCKLLAPRLESIMTAHHDKIHLAKVDVDENTDLAFEYDVSAVPVVIAVKGGKIVDRFIGLLDEDQIKSFVDKLIGP